MDFSQELHNIRTDELRASERVAGTMVSIGCNSRYYFDWIHENLGKPDQHIGLEYYMPRPDDLPENVVWVANTAGNMEGVRSQSVNLVFAGQTIEHLWADELVGFLLDCTRVLLPGGRLILDSPNEEITHALRWNHPEHTIELRPHDAETLLRAAGFDIIKTVGHWLCREDGIFLELVDGEQLDNRIKKSRTRPQDSFSWWIEAKLMRPSDSVRVARIVDDLWRKYSHSRLHRMLQSNSPQIVQIDADHYAIGANNWVGYLLFGPYAPLPPGRSIVGVDIGAYSSQKSPGHFEIFHTIGDTVLASVLLPPIHYGGVIWLDVDLPATVFGVEYRVFTNGAAALRVKIDVDVLKGYSRKASEANG
jgi:SAM-dependent methyltransferase